MKRLIYFIFFWGFSSLFLTSCINHTEENNQTNQVTDVNKMEKDEKESLYESYDQIEIQNGKDFSSPSQMSQLQEIDTQDQYEEIIETSNQEAQVIYVGFNDCPYCRAFLPKLDLLASSYKVNYHYYNTDLRAKDMNFSSVINDFLNITTVPHAFVIKNEKIIATIDNSSSMEEIENFIKIASKK
ncbi:thioredoxin family protein [Facklamia sp. DSM 111018]|uniref:Thioredoxin family protein n=1 Tax=Facklamia lactis TaxID=2749967 RepID=A0ABS0LUW8_9LACT|nr:thioredoxin family protein [Facklamia lactis]MBG9981268.1 thioredoxin family protein [Facklamia lactis]MBG9987255.1 thioredoxin family protein [Facklamia lactis]